MLYFFRAVINIQIYSNLLHTLCHIQAYAISGNKSYLCILILSSRITVACQAVISDQVLRLVYNTFPVLGSAVFMGIFGPVKEKLSGPCVLFMTRDFVGDAVVTIMNSWGQRWTGRFAKTVGTMGREVQWKGFMGNGYLEDVV